VSLNLKVYDPGIHCELAYWMAMAGQREEEIAEKFGIPLGTLHSWRNRHPELRDAMKPGRDFTDTLVKGSLLKRALGFEYIEVTRERVPVDFDVVGKVAVPVKWKMMVTKRVKKIIPGDVGAQAFYLKNRCGWKDRSELAVEHSGSMDVFSMTPAQRQARIDELLVKRTIQGAGKN
jgi:hypothetical protein